MLVPDLLTPVCVLTAGPPFALRGVFRLPVRMPQVGGALHTTGV